MMENVAPNYMWCWAMFKATQDLYFNYNSKIDTSPYQFVTRQHIDMKYLRSSFAECYMFMPLKDRKGKLPYRRAQRCWFLVYLYTIILVPTYITTPWFDNRTYGGSRISKDIIFDESCVFDKYIDSSPTDEEFAALPHRIGNLHPESVAVVKKVKFAEYELHNTNILPTPAGLPVAESIGVLSSPPLHMYDPQNYKDLHGDKPDTPKEPFPLVVSDTSEYVQEVDEYGTPIY